MSSSAQLRRSARIAAKNAAKASSKNTFELVLQTNPVPSFTFLTGPGSQGKSPLFLKLQEMSPLFLKEAPQSISNCQIEYIVYPIDSDIENPEVLKELIARHEMRYENDLRNAAQIYTTEWERELDAMSRWLCIDRRILKASPEMYDKAKAFAHKINFLFPSLYEKIKALEEKQMRLQGVEGDHADRELLWANVLRRLAHHGHDKWNRVWKECAHKPTFKPEMGWSSDDDY